MCPMPAGRVGRANGGANVAFMGELSDIGVADLLYLLAVRRQTGKLTINANADEIHLFLDDGRLLLVNSSDLALRLGRTLLRLGMIDNRQLQDVLQEQESAGRALPLGHILVSRGWVTPEQVAHCVEEQCVEALARIIAADHGIFIYSNGVTPPKRTEVVPLNADRILLEAMRRTDELSTLRRLLPAPAAPLVVSDRIDEVADTLSDGEVLVVATLLSGAGSLAELADEVALDELVLWRTVISLRERGLLLAGHDDATSNPSPLPSTGVEQLAGVPGTAESAAESDPP